MRVSDSGLGFGPALCSLRVGRQLFPRSPRIYPYLSFLRNTKRYSFVLKICERIASRKMNRSLMDIIKGYVSESIEILLNRHKCCSRRALSCRAPLGDLTTLRLPRPTWRCHGWTYLSIYCQHAQSATLSPFNSLPML